MSIILKKLQNIEKQVKELSLKFDSISPKRRTVYKGEEMREWIESFFEDENNIPVWKIMEAGQDKGYSKQMIQKVRAERCLTIKSSHAGKNGWIWYKLSKKEQEKLK